MKKVLSIGLVTSMVVLAGCQSAGVKNQANVFKADQVNSKQEARMVDIIAVMPAQIEVDNKEGKQAAQFAGALLGGLAGAAISNQQKNTSTGNNALAGAVGAGVGGAAGSLASDKVLVEGVSLTYKENDKLFTSAQVGRQCEFKPGTALVIAATDKETRIQPNATCPVEK